MIRKVGVHGKLPGWADTGPSLGDAWYLR